MHFSLTFSGSLVEGKLGQRGIVIAAGGARHVSYTTLKSSVVIPRSPDTISRWCSECRSMLCLKFDEKDRSSFAWSATQSEAGREWAA